MLSLWGLLTYFYNWEVTYAYILCFVDKQFIHVRMMYSQNIWVRVLYVIANIFDSEFCCSSPYSTCLFTVVFVLEYCSILNDKIRNMHNWCQYQGWLASSYQVSSIQLTHPLYIFRTIDSPQMNTNIHFINTSTIYSALCNLIYGCNLCIIYFNITNLDWVIMYAHTNITKYQFKNFLNCAAGINFTLDSLGHFNAFKFNFQQWWPSFQVATWQCQRIQWALTELRHVAWDV